MRALESTARASILPLLVLGSLALPSGALAADPPCSSPWPYQCAAETIFAEKRSELEVITSRFSSDAQLQKVFLSPILRSNTDVLVTRIGDSPTHIGQEEDAELRTALERTGVTPAFRIETGVVLFLGSETRGCVQFDIAFLQTASQPAQDARPSTCARQLPHSGRGSCDVALFDGWVLSYEWLEHEIVDLPCDSESNNDKSS